MAFVGHPPSRWLRALLGGVAAAITLISCAPANTDTPAASNLSADRQQIEAAAGRIWDAVARADAAAILLEYADDAVILGPGGPAVKGRSALAPYLSELFKAVAFRDVLGAATDIDVSGNLGVETGTYSWTLVPFGGRPTMDEGKYLHVWARTPKGWKVVRYMANSDLASQ